MSQNPRLVAGTMAAAIFNVPGAARNQAFEVLLPLVTETLRQAHEDGARQTVDVTPSCGCVFADLRARPLDGLCIMDEGSAA